VRKLLGIDEGYIRRRPSNDVPRGEGGLGNST
jgi:hypothetical protein